MDERLKYIAENYEQMKIGPDDPFRFHCKECGKCCIHREDILLSPHDLFRAARELGMTTVEFYNQYCEGYIGQDSRLTIIRLMPQGSVRIPKDKTSAEDAELQIQYILQPPACGDRSETHTVRKWLASFGMDVEDPIFLQWQRFILFAHNKIVELEKKLEPAEMNRCWNLLAYCAYMNYDTGKVFSPQFEENLAAARKLLEAYERAAQGVQPDAG